MRKTVTCLLALVLGSAVLPTTWSDAVGAAEVQRFTLTVLRRDGLLLPFASYAHKRWDNYWPTPKTDVEVPLSLTGVPSGWWPQRKPVVSWTAWPVDGPSRPIQIASPAWVGAHCQMNVALKSDYKSSEPVPPPEMQPYPKDGLATTGAVTIERVDVLNDRSPDWAQVAAGAADAVTEAETADLRRFTGTPWRHPADAKGRAGTPLRLEVLCRSLPTGAGAIAYYFEATKQYRNPRDRGARRCDIITFATGWVWKTTDGKMDGTVKAFTTDCAMESMLYTLPLGQFRVDGKLLWALQVSGWGYERYEIVEIGNSRVRKLFATAGGWCQ
jgi:hypothetical protein